MQLQQKSFVIALGLLILWGQVSSAQSTPPAKEARGEESEEEAPVSLITARTERAISKGFDWLIARQQRRGNWMPEKRENQMAVSALAGLAVLASGEVSRRGPNARRELVERLVRYVVKNQTKEGLFADALTPIKRPMHGHGFALLLLAEVYGEIRDPAFQARVATAIRKGVELTTKSQSKRGGWHYFPGSLEDEGSVTVTQIQALRSARNGGFAVPIETVRRAVNYVRKSQTIFGGVRYSQTFGKETPALTCAGLTVFYGAGVHADPFVHKGFRYLQSKLKTELGKDERFFFYTHFYAAQAYHHRGGENWPRYFRGIRETLMTEQSDEGSWSHIVLGKQYATAMALLILQVPREYLPIFQR